MSMGTPADASSSSFPSLFLSPCPPAYFVLEDGSVYRGVSFGCPKPQAGEVVFNTGMVGYPESLTDPSYRGQILVLTFPLIGNYGVPSDEFDELGLMAHFESNSLQIAALVISHYPRHESPSHYTSRRSLAEWLTAHGVPGICSIDTRAITKKIRDHGAMKGKIVFHEDHIQSFPFEDPNERNLVAEVSRRVPVTYGRGRIKIIAIDCGMKNNIIRYLVNNRKIELKIVPWDWDIEEENYDGLFISNGPGDPKKVEKTIANVRKLLQNKEYDKPIFGICLGNQIMALAAGATTYKMKFGNRGMNQPCIDMRTTRCYITPQNHGFAVDDSTLPDDWQTFFRNANDGTNEGILHKYKPFFSVQFHPEARGGPTDTEFLFDLFLDRVRDKRNVISTVVLPPPLGPIRKVLLLGSGGLSIGQAGEFDYSGSQAIKALKEENLFIILINPNIATVQTSPGMADKVYFLPITPPFIEEVIKKERPDGILLQFGGQTGLNAGIALEKLGILAKYNVRVLGTPVSTIVATEDREVFAKKLEEIKEKTAPSATVYSVEEALKAAETIGYPVLIRAGFALGGLGSGFANDPESLRQLSSKAFHSSSQIIIDKSLKGWKEVEYEVVRDAKGNTITVANMENFDPLGIHTGDSIVVAPSQTLSNEEYYMLRQVAIKVVRHLGVVGECNIQYALDPTSNQYCIIEVNARLSRSSALASKATGYPLAYVAAKLSLGLSLSDIANSVTKTTTACFEPALDYVVVKIPRWDMRKFNHVSDSIGSAMKSVGEVMSIGRSFEEAFQKAIRMVDNSLDGFGDTQQSTSLNVSNDQLDILLREPNDQRVFAIALALQRGYTVERIYELTKIDQWFLNKLRNVIVLEGMLKSFGEYAKKETKLGSSQVERKNSPTAGEVGLANLDRKSLLNLKQHGFSDRQIARCLDLPAVDWFSIRQLRKRFDLHPWVKQMDTLAAEFPAQSIYLYMTYHGEEHDMTFDDHGVLVLGCGAYRIGSSCEFDWCAVSCIRTLRKLECKSVMLNYNPETVSTDYDECDRLYFDEISLETTLDIYEVEGCRGVILSVGGQIPNNLAVKLHTYGCHILGTTANSIDLAENRQKFSQLLDELGVDQAPWKQLSTLEDAKTFAESVGFPVLVRPSYVLSGAAMNVASNCNELTTYLGQAAKLGMDHPVVISKFIVNAKEIEYDGVANDGAIVNFAISEHIENAGVHSGDATLVLPAQKLYVETIKRIKKIAAKIASALKISGPFNIQLMSRNNEIKVIECNLRASRSLPFVSKTFNVNFVELATRIVVGAPFKASRIELMDVDHVGVKVPMFSFTRLQGADPVLRVEMASTGEVACFSSKPLEALFKGLLAAGMKTPSPSKPILVSIGPFAAKVELLPAMEKLSQMGFQLIGTVGTAEFYKKQGLQMTTVEKDKMNEVVAQPKEKEEQKEPERLQRESSESTPPSISGRDSPSASELQGGILTPTPKKSSFSVPSSMTAASLLRSKLVGLVINIPNTADPIDVSSGYRLRRAAVDCGIDLITNLKNVIQIVDAIEMVTTNGFKYEIRSWDEYMREAKII